ncbi:hypothetical protein ACM43_12850 [Bradyrhizobium sp. CCBAU 45321]|uniref:hypothetical protein n=1 Tax=Bradyrhizobium sp. CCBAU 45321 TaxID=1641878 RepID=UPI002302E4BA|nr:hypothetical protein [Bradyrhizobium sp. CCBAU 45321]MDA9545315.1 hypothetical protein [Bradyrhizobium sp. CCBAU 45321]
MKEGDKFGIWIAGAALRAGARDIDVLTLEDLGKQAETSGDLEQELAAMRQFDKEGGDFGAEIIGAIVIPILIEAGKQLWAAYVKKLTDKAAGALADATTDGVVQLVEHHWTDAPVEAASEFEAIVRAVGARQKLPQAQIDELAAAVRSSAMTKEVSAA